MHRFELTIWVHGLKGRPALREVNNRSVEEVRSFARACASFVLKEKQRVKEGAQTLPEKIRVMVEIKRHNYIEQRFSVEYLAFDENLNLLGVWTDAKLIPAA